MCVPVLFQIWVGLLGECVNIIHIQSIRRARPNHNRGGNGQICEELFDCRAFHTEITTPPRVRAVLYQEHIDDCYSNTKQKICYSGVTLVNKLVI